jgi:hypothetical protein
MTKVIRVPQSGALRAEHRTQQDRVVTALARRIGRARAVSNVTSSTGAGRPGARPRARPGQVIIYHAWKNYQFAGGKGSRT